MEPKVIVDKESDNRIGVIVDISIKLVALAALLISCYFIIEPFVALIVWASVLSISLNPLFLSLKKLFRGKGGLAATVITVLFMLLLIAPIVWMSISTGMSLQSLGEQVKSGELAIPPPNESVKSFPRERWGLCQSNFSQVSRKGRQRFRGESSRKISKDVSPWLNGLSLRKTR